MMGSGVFQKFLRSLDGIARSGYRLPRKVALALSGGVDSVVLLDLLVRYKRAVRSDLEIHAVTIDHGLRPESSLEAARLQELITGGERPPPITHKILRIDRKINRRQLERHARELRYGLIYGYCERQGIRCLFMGHHGDDQLETFVLRLLSGSTLFGLAGMRPVAPGNLERPHEIDLVRPLLGVPKRELYGHAREHRLTWFEDRTNSDAALTPRNRIRQFLSDPVNAKTRHAVSQLHTRVCTLLDECVYARLREQRQGRNAPNVRMESRLDEELMALTLDISVRRTYWAAGVSTIDFLVLDRWIFNQVWLVSPSRRYLYGYTRFDSKYCVVEPTERGRSLSELILQSRRRKNMTLAGCFLEWEEVEDDRGRGNDEFFRIRIHVYREHEHRRHVLAAGSRYRVSLNSAEDNVILYDHRLFLEMQADSGKKGEQVAALNCSTAQPAAVYVQNFNMGDFSAPERFSPSLLGTLASRAEDEHGERLEGRHTGDCEDEIESCSTGLKSTKKVAFDSHLGDNPLQFSAGMKKVLRRLDKAQVPVLCDDATGQALCLPTLDHASGDFRGSAKRPPILLQVQIAHKRTLFV